VGLADLATIRGAVQVEARATGGECPEILRLPAVQGQRLIDLRPARAGHGGVQRLADPDRQRLFGNDLVLDGQPREEGLRGRRRDRISPAI
jgi:hypothetical protein